MAAATSSPQLTINQQAVLSAIEELERRYFGHLHDAPVATVVDARSSTPITQER